MAPGWGALLIRSCSRFEVFETVHDGRKGPSYFLSIHSAGWSAAQRIQDFEMFTLGGADMKDMRVCRISDSYTENKNF